MTKYVALCLLLFTTILHPVSVAGSNACLGRLRQPIKDLPNVFSTTKKTIDYNEPFKILGTSDGYTEISLFRDGLRGWVETAAVKNKECPDERDVYLFPENTRENSHKWNDNLRIFMEGKYYPGLTFSMVTIVEHSAYANSIGKTVAASLSRLHFARGMYNVNRFKNDIQYQLLLKAAMDALISQTGNMTFKKCLLGACIPPTVCVDLPDGGYRCGNCMPRPVQGPEYSCLACIPMTYGSPMAFCQVVIP